MIKVRRALISVSDKTGLVPFARGLHARGVVLISTGGTARHLRAAGLPVTDVARVTGFPEILDGRVKTLHPKVFGGILARKESPEHMTQIKRERIDPIDLVVVNLYPFPEVVRKSNVAMAEALENIDIGGPSLLRAAAKNFRGVAVVCDPRRYPQILEELDRNSGMLSDAVLRSLALEVFETTAWYDAAIAEFLRRRLKSAEPSALPQDATFRCSKIRDLRYGENPHQRAAVYRPDRPASGLAALVQHHGKELSFNNYLDLDAAAAVVRDFERPAAVVVKHGNPTGVAESDSLARAFEGAWRCDPISAFGGIIGLNRIVDAETAERVINAGFVECVIAPGFRKGALRILQRKKNLRVIEADVLHDDGDPWDIRRIDGAFLIQDRDTARAPVEEWRTVTRKRLTAAARRTADFGWTVVRHVRSNAIVLVKGTRTVGIGCGQTSRVESVRLAVRKAGARARGAVLVSDAFLPKVDNVHLAAEAGVKAIVQSGGSIADAEVIRAADAAGLAMAMTGMRHFKH